MGVKKLLGLRRPSCKRSVHTCSPLLFGSARFPLHAPNPGSVGASLTSNGSQWMGIWQGNDSTVQVNCWLHDEEASTADPEVHSESQEDIENVQLDTEVTRLTYSILLARSHYYEVVKQRDLNPETPIISFGDTPQCYAVPFQPDFTQYLANRTALNRNASLHICVHNPMLYEERPHLRVPLVDSVSGTSLQIHQ